MISKFNRITASELKTFLDDYQTATGNEVINSIEQNLNGVTMPCRISKKRNSLKELSIWLPPLRFESHAKSHSAIMTWLGTYWMATPGIRLGDNATVRFNENNEYQPDAVLFLPPSYGGKVIITADDYIQGAP